MSNPRPAHTTTPTQVKILEVLAHADYRHVLRISSEDTATLRSELGWPALDAQALQERVRDWLGRSWIINVDSIMVDAHETSSRRE